MPKGSINVYLTAEDKMSPTLASITDKVKALDKESQELQETFDALQKANKTLIERKTELQQQLKAVNDEVKDARKNFNSLHDEASSDALTKAVEKQQKLKNEIAGTTKALKENQKIYQENIETIRKSGMEEQGTSLGDIAKGIFAGQIGQMFASSLGGLGQSALTSAIGTPEASLISDTLSSAISGGTAGAVFGLPGVAIGAALGGISGLISGSTKIFEAKDDAFKDYYGGLYEDVSSRSGEMVESGSTIAGGREQTRMAFSQRLGGDKQADTYLARVEEMAANTNYDYDEITGYTKLLLNSYDPDEVFGVLQKLSDATAGLDLSSSDVNMMISGLSRMRTTGKATQEYLNYFRERGVDTDQALAEALTESTGKAVEKSAIADMVHDGDISGEDAAQAILDFIQKEFGGLSETLAGTYDAMVDNLGDINASLEAQGGDAYNTLRKEGVEAEKNALSGALGDAIGEINSVMGENQARRENMQEQYMREALEAVLLGQEGSVFSEEQNAALAELSAQYAEMKARYDESKGADAEAGAQMEALYEEAQTLGQAYFDNSDFVKMLNDTELDEIAAIRENTAGLENAYTALYNLSQELSKGLAATYEMPTYMAAGTAVWFPFGYGAEKYQYKGNSHAFGLERVPYDEYPALLHEGERVLTASEARSQDAERAGVSPIQITTRGNSHAFGLERVPYDEYPALLHEGERVLTASEARSQDAEQAGVSPIQITTRGNSHAFGLERVPYDEYPALLHEGERVLTASEARSQDAERAGASPIQITITGNSFTGTTEEIADQLAEILVRKISQAVTAAAPR